MKLARPEGKLLEDSKRRLPILLIVFSCVFFFLLLRVWYLQVVHGDEMTLLSENNRVRERPIQPFRGKIFDRKMREIVNNRPSFNLQIIPEDIEDMELFLSNIATGLQFDEKKVRTKLGATIFSFQEVDIKKDISFNEVAFVEENKMDLPGIQLDIAPLRSYVYGETASHLIGYLGQISKRQLADSKYNDYRLGDYIGRTGLEKVYEPLLKGERGSKRVEVDAAGREIRTLQVKDPKLGNNIVLTIDIELQQEAEKFFDDKNGSLVLINVRNGNILAMVSKPSFNPNFFSGSVSPREWRRLLRDPMKPLQNKAIAGQYPPGSVYKIVMAAAGLEEGIITPETIVDCPGHFRLGRKRYNCWKKSGHGTMDLESAITQSCDVYFYSLGFRLGIDKIAQYAKEFGLGLKTGIELLGEKAGLIPTREWKEKVRGEKWIAGETISCSIGQGYNLVTPLQIATLMAGVANNGVLLKPRLVDRVETAEGEAIKQFSSHKNSRIKISPENMAPIREALYKVVNSRRGTGQRSKVRGVKVAGKTGTTQVVSAKKVEGIEEEEIPHQYRDHAWFGAYAPYESPEIAVAVLVEHGGHGGAAAAPIAGKIIKKYFEIEKKVASKANQEKRKP